MAKQSIVERAVEKEQSMDVDIYSRAAEFFTAYIGAEIQSTDVAVLQILFALAKEGRNPSRENLGDIICEALVIAKLRS